MQKNIIKIPAKSKYDKNGQIIRKKRVAAYARVSTDKEQQLSSYESQLDYYEKYIKSNEEWEFVKLYSDEGISGTSCKNRKGFQEMIADSMEGKIDLILTKSISRFSRNVIDSLTKARELRNAGVEVFFEKENISTTDPQSEFVFTIMASVAQEESRSLSMNISWGYHKRFEDGIYSLPYNEFLGFEKGPDGKIQVNKIEANIAKRIYYMFLQGYAPANIVEILTNEGVETPGHKDKWYASTVISILKNEKYCGDALLQKTINIDYLSKQRKKNEGEQDQYYIKDAHEAIISKDDYYKVQEKIKLLGVNWKKRSEHLFSNLIYCHECGCTFGYRVWHPNTPHETYSYCCNQIHRKEHTIAVHHKEEYLINQFLFRLNNLTKDIDLFNETVEKIIKINLDFTYVNKEIKTLKEDIKMISKLEGFENRIISDNERIKSLEKLKNHTKNYANNVYKHIDRAIKKHVLPRDLLDFFVLKVNSFGKKDIQFELKNGLKI